MRGVFWTKAATILLRRLPKLPITLFWLFAAGYTTIEVGEKFKINLVKSQLSLG